MSIDIHRRVVCAHCHRDRPHQARGLCSACYKRLRENGGLDEYRTTRYNVPQVDRYDWVVVHLLMAGRPATVHPTERDATARELIARGMPPYRAGELCGMSHRAAMDLAVTA